MNVVYQSLVIASQTVEISDDLTQGKLSPCLHYRIYADHRQPLTSNPTIRKQSSGQYLKSLFERFFIYLFILSFFFPLMLVQTVFLTFRNHGILDISQKKCVTCSTIN